MSYQPIQMGEFQAPGFSDAIIAARQLDRQKEQDRWAQLRDQGAMDAQKQVVAHQQFEDQRQHQADLDAKHAEIQRLYDAGLGHQAEQFAQMHGFTFAQQPNTGKAPTAPQMPQEPQAPVEPEQGPILPQSQPSQYQGGGLDHFDAGAASQNLGGIADPAAIEHMRQMQAERDAAAAYPGKLDEYGRQMTEVFPQQQAAYEKGKATYDQRAANPVVNFTGNGTSFSVDPLEARQAQIAQNERRAQQFREAFAGVPEMAAYAGPGAAMIQAGEDIKPSDVFGMAKADAAARLKREEDATAAAKVKWEQEHKGELSEEALKQQTALARIRASATASTQAPFKKDAADRSDLNSLRQEQKAWVSENQLNVDSKSAKRLSTVMANISSDNSMQQREAAESMVSIFKGGGQVTKASQDLLLKHLAGIVGDAQTWLSHIDSGHFGAKELEVLQKAAQGALDEEHERAQAYFQSYRDRFGPGSGWENMAGNVNHNARSYFRQFGIEVPDVYDGQPGSVVLGAGRRPASKPAASASPPSKPAELHGPGGKVLKLGADGLYH
jgi:hypothetical protein